MGGFGDARDRPTSIAKWTLWSAAIAVALVAVWWFVGWVVPTWVFGETVEERGIRGDAFGGVAALFSGLAFAGVIVAILMQREELELQRTELEYTRAELKGQRQALEQQLDTLNRQRFESTFFQLVRLHHEIVGAVSIERRRVGPSVGRMAFQEIFWAELRNRLGQAAEGTRVVRDSDEATTKAAQDQIEAIYQVFYLTHEASLGHYFRNLYNIVKIVDRSDRGDAEKRVYTNLIRAQLSSAELALLLYNCFGPGREKFRPLVLRYDLLQNLPKGFLGIPEHRDLFDSLDASAG